MAGYPGGKLIALDLDDGKLTWEVTVSLPRGSTELERVPTWRGFPSSRRAASARRRRSRARWRASTSRAANTLWTRDYSSATGLALDDKSAYLADDQDNVHALDRDTGASRWRQDKLLRRSLTAPVVVDGKVVVGDSLGYLHVLSKDDGALIGRIEVDGGAVNAMVRADGGLLVQTAGGTVFLHPLLRRAPRGGGGGP